MDQEGERGDEGTLVGHSSRSREMQEGDGEGAWLGNYMDMCWYVEEEEEWLDPYDVIQRWAGMEGSSEEGGRDPGDPVAGSPTVAPHPSSPPAPAGPSADNGARPHMMRLLLATLQAWVGEEEEEEEDGEEGKGAPSPMHGTAGEQSHAISLSCRSDWSCRVRRREWVGLPAGRRCCGDGPPSSHPCTRLEAHVTGG